MAQKKRKKSARNSINWPQTLVGALADFSVGLLLILIGKILK